MRTYCYCTGNSVLCGDLNGKEILKEEMYVCMYVCVCVYIYICMYVCIYVYFAIEQKLTECCKATILF